MVTQGDSPYGFLLHPMCASISVLVTTLALAEDGEEFGNTGFDVDNPIVNTGFSAGYSSPWSVTGTALWTSSSLFYTRLCYTVALQYSSSVHTRILIYVVRQKWKMGSLDEFLDLAYFAFFLVNRLKMLNR